MTVERRTSDVLAGAVLGAVGVAYTIIAMQTPPDPSTASVIGPAVVPSLLGSLLAIGGAALAISGLRPRPVEPGDEAPQSGSKRLWITLAILAAYVVAFIPVGYLLSTAAFLMGITSYFSPKTFRGNLAFALVFPVVVFALFEYVLQVPLPEGLLTGVLP